MLNQMIHLYYKHQPSLIQKSQLTILIFESVLMTLTVHLHKSYDLIMKGYFLIHSNAE